MQGWPPPTPKARDPRSAEALFDGRVPPQDLEAEMSLLGSMLLERDCIGQVLQLIPREQAHRFYRPDHRLLYETLVDLYDNNSAIDLIVLEDELRRRGRLEVIGGREYLITLSESVPSAANAEFYAGIVRNKAWQRDLIGVTGEILKDAYDAGMPAADLMDLAEKKLFAVTEQRVTNQAVTIREFLAETFHQIETMTEGGLTGVPSGFQKLNEMLGGFQLGDLVIVAARPSMGKTALALNMFEHAGIDEGRPAVFFSLEMGKLQIAQRMLCSRAHVDMHRLRRGRLSEHDIQSLHAAADVMRDRAVFVDDTPGMSVMELRAKARRLKRLHKIEVIFVDYLQLMFDRARRESRQEEVSAISRGLKALARELEVPVVAMAQLNRQVESRSGNRPRMSDLRESGAIEQDADVVILLHREEYYCADKNNIPPEIKGKAELIIEKQRNGPTGIVELIFNPEFTRFEASGSQYLRDEGEYQAAAYHDRAAPAPMDEAAPPLQRGLRFSPGTGDAKAADFEAGGGDGDYGAPGTEESPF